MCVGRESEGKGGRSRVLFQVCQSSQDLFLGCHKHEVLPLGVTCLCILCIAPTFSTLKLIESCGFC